MRIIEIQEDNGGSGYQGIGKWRSGKQGCRFLGKTQGFGGNFKILAGIGFGTIPYGKSKGFSVYKIVIACRLFEYIVNFGGISQVHPFSTIFGCVNTHI